MGDNTIGFVMSAMLAGALLWMLQPVAHRFGLVDHPKGRKDHACPTPITGGLSIAIAVLATLFLVGDASPALVAFATGASLLIVVGLVDDAVDLRWWWRILSQVAAALIMVYWGGVKVEYIGLLFSDAPLVLGAWSVPFTVFATVGIINAVNMADGSDGLAGSLCLVGLFMLGMAALYAGNDALFSLLLPVAAAIVAFLWFNMRLPWQRRARVFLSNAGSTFLGFTIAWMAFRLTQNANHPVSPVLAPWLLAPPVIDCLVLIARRIKLGRSPFHADRDHMHHLLLDAGFTPTQIALGLAGVSLALGLGAALLLKTDVGTETHLAIAFLLLTGAYYWLTSRRTRAVAILSRLRRTKVEPSCPVLVEPSRSARASTRPSRGWRRRTARRFAARGGKL
ncbi:MAG: undecaprenyl/decaprenyl-phosphate alpha-N-acetylglucosaminyl 1-phosphate transferase [Chloroflexota bacterium]|nr:undecaprenyl/decaprenyl-phosphate alpha-N-acetylglucosaminyl 1-phosphate transferase [Chloroflexota bacterium]